MATTTNDVRLLAGPQILGLFFNWALQGVLTVQIYIYYLWFPHDRPSTKLLVYGILVYEWVQTGLITDFAFDNFVYGYGQRTALTQFHNSWFSVTIMCSVISWVVQTFFAWRIWVLGRSRVLTGFILFISFAQMSVGVAGGILLRVVDPSAASASAVTPVVSSWLGGAALADILIAVSMTILLTKGKNGMKRSDDMIDSLVRLVIETGTLTALVAILDLAFFTGLSSTLLHECPALVLAKLYSNTLLASLNNRAIMRMSRSGPVLDAGTHTFELSVSGGSGGGHSHAHSAGANTIDRDGIPGVYALSSHPSRGHGRGLKGGLGLLGRQPAELDSMGSVGGDKRFRVDVREETVVARDFSTAPAHARGNGRNQGMFGDDLDELDDKKVPVLAEDSDRGSRRSEGDAI